MQFLSISSNTTLSELSDMVGSRNVDNILHNNGLSRVPRIGQAFDNMCARVLEENPNNVTHQRKISILNRFVSDSDVFETAALLGETGWRLLSAIGTFPGMLSIPASIILKGASAILGDNQGIGSSVYKNTMRCLIDPPHTVDPSVFNKYSSIKSAKLIEYTQGEQSPFQYFKIPWGEITLYSSLSNESVDFPVYPEQVSDGVKANYIQMPELLYQYEPWQIYSSSGPRANTYEFDFHRDMWNGDHRIGGANNLIRFCMANCYPRYTGSAVHTSTVTLYVKGRSLIRGVLTDVNVNWDGPIGLDGWYLHCKLSLTITEVSEEPLNYDSVREKPLIG